jgi:hypothetical protein
MDLVESYMPSSNDISWDDFFETANARRLEFGAEVYDAFDYGNIRDYLEWYETAGGVNDSGLCGQAMLYQYLMSIRAELFFITSYGSFAKSSPTCAEGKFCWKPKAALLSNFATKYKDQMLGYKKILTARTQGGLGIAHLVRKSFSELLEGFQVDDTSGFQRGFCFRCDQDYNMSGGGSLSHCHNKTFVQLSYPAQHEKLQPGGQWPDGNEGVSTSNQLDNQLDKDKLFSCNSNDFPVDWWYWDTAACHEAGSLVENGVCCPGGHPAACSKGNKQWQKKYTCSTRVITDWNIETKQFDGKPKNLGCCACSCTTSDDHDHKLGGVPLDHTKYDRHCPAMEEVLFPEGMQARGVVEDPWR